MPKEYPLYGRKNVTRLRHASISQAGQTLNHKYTGARPHNHREYVLFGTFLHLAQQSLFGVALLARMLQHNGVNIENYLFGQICDMVTGTLETQEYAFEIKTELGLLRMLCDVSGQHLRGGGIDFVCGISSVGVGVGNHMANRRLFFHVEKCIAYGNLLRHIAVFTT